MSVDVEFARWLAGGLLRVGRAVNLSARGGERRRDALARKSGRDVAAMVLDGERVSARACVRWASMPSTSAAELRACVVAVNAGLDDARDPARVRALRDYMTTRWSETH